MGLPISHLPPESTGMLTRLASERATGVLRGPTGCFYLRDGAVTCVESPQSPGLDVRLGATGRLSSRRWREATEAAGKDCAGGRFLVRRGWLTQGELEVGQLTALLDAAFFALPLPAGKVSFTPDTAHWMGVVCRISVASLIRATARRRVLLDRLSPWAAVDTVPVVTVRPAEPSATTARQRRLLDGADGSRTPTELACVLGQSAYLTLLDVRTLAAAGHVRMPGTRASALPRRQPGTHLDERPDEGSEGPVPVWPVAELPQTSDPDLALLARLRTALEDNL